MLQKLENFYLGTLRLVVILAATLLLVAMFVMGMKAAPLAQKQPLPATAAPSVSVASLKSTVIEAPFSADNGSVDGTAPSATSDPNQPYYLQVARAIDAYLNRVYPGQYDLNQESLANFVKSKVEGDRTAERQSILAKDLAKAVPKLLADPAMDTYGKDHDPNEIIGKALEAFTTEFDRQLAEVDARNQVAEEKYLAEQAAGRKNLLYAVYAFGVFLLIVFLSIIIRIERNLRPATAT